MEIKTDNGYIIRTTITCINIIDSNGDVLAFVKTGKKTLEHRLHCLREDLETRAFNCPEDSAEREDLEVAALEVDDLISWEFPEEVAEPQNDRLYDDPSRYIQL